MTTRHEGHGHEDLLKLEEGKYNWLHAYIGEDYSGAPPALTLEVFCGDAPQFYNLNVEECEKLVETIRRFIIAGRRPA